jgi:hypothetical protein
MRTCFTEDCHADHGEIGVWAGDGVAARGYVEVLFVGAATGSGVQAAGTYDDELVRTGDGWKIARRHFTMVQMAPIERG